MLEPIVQDYVHAFTQLDRDSFCRHIGAAVLIIRSTKDGHTFQLAATDLVGVEQAGRGQPIKQRPGLHPNQPVIELRKSQPGSMFQFYVGRSEENDLVIMDETVSSRHAAFFRDSRGVYTLQDLESTNGTTLNKRPLLPGRAMELREGDVIAFGDSEYTFYTAGGLYDVIASSISGPVG